MKKIIFAMAVMGMLLSCSNRKDIAKDELSDEEIQHCEAFSSMRGHERYNEMMRLVHLFPSVENNDTRIKTKDKLKKHLGEADSTGKDGELFYYLSNPKENTCRVVFYFSEREEIVYVNFENCKASQKKNKAD